jgi:hypothetical protein
MDGEVVKGEIALVLDEGRWSFAGAARPRITCAGHT